MVSSEKNTTKNSRQAAELSVENLEKQDPQAVLWDMDGTILDTEPFWDIAQNHLVDQFNGTWSQENNQHLTGKSLAVSAQALQKVGVDLSIDEIIAVMVDSVRQQMKESLTYMPGAYQLLHEAHSKNIPLALVTMSHSPMVQVFLDQLPPDFFDVVITGDKVTYSKPDPEPYRLGIEVLEEKFGSLDLDRVLAFEDSFPGSTSALEAGLQTVLIHPQDRSIEDVPEDDRLRQVVNTLEGRTLDSFLS